MIIIFIAKAISWCNIIVHGKGINSRDVIVPTSRYNLKGLCCFPLNSKNTLFNNDVISLGCCLRLSGLYAGII